MSHYKKVKVSLCKFRLPLKTKLASGNAVVGNGMTMGFTDGSNEYGLMHVQSIAGDFRKGSYGKSVGATDATGTISNINVSMGLTTDPTKSGICKV